MENAFEGLYFYEIVLIVLGTLLFLALLFGLVFYIIKGRELKKLLLFFLIPIVMIGYPSIQMISIDNGKFEIQKYTYDLKNDPTDTVAINTLTELVNEYDKREFASPELTMAIGEAHSLLGNDTKAIKYADQALESMPSLKEAKVLKAISEVSQTVKLLNVGDNSGVLTESDKKSLENNLTLVENSNHQDVGTKLKMAEGYLLLKDTSKANSYVKPILEQQPNFKSANILNNRINRTQNTSETSSMSEAETLKK